MDQNVRVTRSLVHCPYCKGALDTPQLLVACAACAARHHGDCWRELGRCATCGGWERLSHRAVVDEAVARAGRLVRRALVASIVTIPLVACFTYIVTVDRNASAPSREAAEELETLARERARLAEEAEEVARAQAHLEVALKREKDRLMDENRAGLDERANVLRETAEQKEEARQLARRGGRVAELVAQGDYYADYYDRSGSALREALRLLPEGPSVLRDDIQTRITLLDRANGRSPTASR